MSDSKDDDDAPPPQGGQSDAPTGDEFESLDLESLPRRPASAPTPPVDDPRPATPGRFAGRKAPTPSVKDERERTTDRSQLAIPDGPRKPSPAFDASHPSRSTPGDPSVQSVVRGAADATSDDDEPSALRADQLVAGRYLLIERLGRGGMGEVWKARHTLLMGLRAIKVIKASISRDPMFRERFLHEGQTMMRVRHPRVVEVTDLDEMHGTGELFMVMEHLEGSTMFDVLRDPRAPLSADVRDAARILQEIALGMQCIHAEGVVHKDLKTDNVLLVLGADGLRHAKVIDFGLAKQVGDGDAAAPKSAAGPTYEADLRTTISGTLAYMAPEQFRGEHSSFRSDIYAFGVMAFETFTGGRFPHQRGGLDHYFSLHKSGAASERLADARADLDRDLTRIVDRCIAQNPDDRPESFHEVADALAWWMGKPERAARRRRVVAVTAGGAALLAAAVWGVFFATTPTLSDVTLSSSGGPCAFADASWFFGARAARSIVVSAAVGGKPGTAVLEIDGVERAVEASVADGRLSARADLSALADGEHVLTIRASRNASPSTLRIDVDRRAPGVVRAVVDGSAGGPTNAESPVVRVDLDEAASRIADVAAVLAGRTDELRAARPEADGAWNLVGTAAADGRVELTVVARDLAGNESRAPFSYVRDTRPPRADVAAVWPGKDGVLELHVKSAAGATCSVVVDEPASVRASFAGRDGEERRLDAPGEVDLTVPPVPEAGLACRLVVKDRAGNATASDLRVVAVEDVCRVSAPGGGSSLAIRGAREFEVELRRTYAVGASARLVVRRVRDAAGAETPEAAPTALDLPVQRTTDEGRTYVYSVPADALAEGAWQIGATVAGDARCVPLDVVVDSTPPRVVSCTVEDADGRAVAPGSFALTPDVVVRATVADLSPRRIELADSPPAEQPRPGVGSYVFRMRCAGEGANTWTLGVLDAAGNDTKLPVTVLADWTVPKLEMRGPAPGAAFDDVHAVEFVGECSEAPFSLRFEGFPDKSSQRFAFDVRTFSQAIQLPAAESLPLVLVAEDAAGHRSAPVPLALRVAHVQTELPLEWSWTNGVAARMRRVDPGDVVIGGRAHSVAGAYLDRTEVTNRDYRAFLQSCAEGDAAWRHADQPKGWSHAPAAATWNDARFNADELPVVNVAYWDAFAFARWSGRRLPTEAEWVKAAAKSRSNTESELRSFPPFADGEWKDGVIATVETTRGLGPVSALESQDVSPVGCLHMGGNVSEWVERSSPPSGESPAGTRGGNWFFSRLAADVKATHTRAYERSFRAATVGFRCAVDSTKVRP